MYAAATLGGATTPSRFAATAARYGYDGVVLFDSVESAANTDIDTVVDRYNIDVVTGANLHTTDRSRVGGMIRAVRDDVEIVRAIGATPAIARTLAEQDRLDVLRWPLDRDDIPHTVVKSAQDHGIAIELNLASVLRRAGTPRVRAIDRLADVTNVLDHYAIPMVVTTDAQTHLELRAPREVQAVGNVIGIPGDRIAAGLEHWGKIAARTRRIRDDRFIEPGVRRIDNETDDR